MEFWGISNTIFMRSHRTLTLEEMGVVVLIDAAKDGQVEYVEWFIDCGTDINGRDHCGQTPLIAACANGQVKCAEVLIKAGADVNLQVEDSIFFSHASKGNALIAAAQRGHVECLDLLISAGADVNLPSGIATNPLLIAVSHGQVECVRRLLLIPEMDSKRVDFQGNSVLTLAAGCQDSECLKIFLEIAKFKKLDVNLRNFSGKTVLMEAARWRHHECVKLILDFPSVDINGLDKYGKSALVYAVQARSLQCVEHLLKCDGIEVNTLFFSELKLCSTLCMACTMWEPEIVLALLKMGADTDHLKTVRKNPLMCMAALGNIPFVKALIQSSFSVFDCCSEYKNPLYYAAKNGHKDCLEVLTEALTESDKHFIGFNAGMNKLFMSSAKNANIFQCLPILLRAKVFSWDWYPRYHKPAIRSLAKVLVTNGYAPEEFSWGGMMSTPLKHAFMLGDAGLVRYYMANLYLTQTDLNDIQKNSYLQHHVSQHGSEEIKSLHQNLCSTPIKLETLSFLKISTSMRKEKSRQEIMKDSDLKLLLPKKFQNRLLFQSHYQSMNVEDWEKIPVNSLDVKGPFWPSASLEETTDDSDSRVELEHVNRSFYQDYFDFDQIFGSESDDESISFAFRYGCIEESDNHDGDCVQNTDPTQFLPSSFFRPHNQSD